jgi:hypothetical protein
MMRHFMKRLQYYRKEGFDIEIIKVNIKWINKDIITN